MSQDAADSVPRLRRSASSPEYVDEKRQPEEGIVEDDPFDEHDVYVLRFPLSANVDNFHSGRNHSLSILMKWKKHTNLHSGMSLTQ